MLKRWTGIAALLLLLPVRPLGAAVDRVATANLTLHDGSRNRDLPLRVYYPRSPDDGRFPVLIFSHDAGGSRDGYAYLGRYWAAHGYVVLVPTHPGSDRSLLKRGKYYLNYLAVKKMVRDKDNLVNRPKDVTFLLDSLPELGGVVPALKDHLDPTRVGVGGHAFGAYTSMAVAGARVYGVKAKPVTFGDTRVEAFLAISPPGPDAGAFRGDSWEPILRPVFMITGTRDRGLEKGETYRWRIKAFEGLRPGHKYLAVISGARREDFEEAPRKWWNRRVQDWVKEATLEFWDAYVKGDRQVQKKLGLEGFPKVKNVRVRVETK